MTTATKHRIDMGLTLATLPTYPIRVRDLTVGQIIDIISPLDAAENYRKSGTERPMGELPWTGGVPPLGTWGFDVRAREYCYLWVFNPHEVECRTEYVEGYEKYDYHMEWRKAGMIPPPVHVTRQTRHDALLCFEATRIAVARSLNVPIWAWVAETRPGDLWAWRIEKPSKRWDSAIDRLRYG